MKKIALFLWLTSCLAPSALAVINVGLQPHDLYKTRYSQVYILEIKAIDPAAGKLETTINQVLKGKLQPQSSITLELTGPMKTVMNDAIAQGDFVVGEKAVAFAGRRRRPKDLMIYAGSFFLGTMTASHHWTLNKSGSTMKGVDGKEIGTLAGTWNGLTDQLVRLVEDIENGTAHFPSKAYARFQKDIPLDRLSGPVSGLAIYDIEGDGDEDIVACSPSGDRIFLQGDPLEFVNATELLGIQTKSQSCALADVNADGLNDLLTGASLHLGRFENNRFRFEPVNWLPSNLSKDLKSASFVELDGDGFPDIVASVINGGLRAFLNPGQGGSEFQEVTNAMGLDTAETGVGLNGFFASGDWNGDRRTDLFYAAGPGFLLVQDSKGTFQPVPHDIPFIFESGIERTPGRTGAGVFLPVLSPDRMDLVVPIPDGWIVVANEDGIPRDITAWGNEISEGSNHHLATIADDWNLDGHVDLFTVSQAQNGHNRYIINRGYGSFMLSTVHKAYEHMFSGPAIESGGLSLSSGDLNGDGAPDLVLGNGEGNVTLILNDTLAVRQPIPHAPREIAVLEKTRLLTVRVMGSRGLVNAKIKVLDSKNQLVARRDLGTNVASGCWDPTQVTFALRKAETYSIKVEYADGLERVGTADLSSNEKQLINIDRGEAPLDDEF